MIIWYVHGAGASRVSFNWLRENLPSHEARFFEYATEDSITDAINTLTAAIAALTQPIILIGHSLGGIIAYACAGVPQVSHLVTLCAPFGGVQHADMLSWVSTAPMYQTLRKYSSTLVDVRTRRLTVPHLAIVGVRGLPHILEPNDGVLTVASQTALYDRTFSHVDLNHFEVLLSPVVASQIDRFLTPA